MVELRRVPIHRALHRANLLFGAERELFLTTGLVAFTLVFVTLTLPGSVFGVLLWVVGTALLRLMGKADPLMSRVYLRHIRYRAYYRAYSTPFRES